MFFDTHAHYFDAKYESLQGGVEGLLDSADFRSQVDGVINVGTNENNSVTAVAMAAKYPRMWCAVGIHPEDCQTYDHSMPPPDPDGQLDAVRALIDTPEKRQKNKIVAIGEIGYDRYWKPVEQERQTLFFERQMQMAGEYGLPVIIHDREAHGLSYDMITRFPDVRGVFHAFSGSAETARQLAQRGWYFGIGGVITYKNAVNCREVCAGLPLDRILLETDCPYLTPVPFRGKINHSGYLIHTARVLAEVRGMSVEELARVTFENAARLFGIPMP